MFFHFFIYTDFIIFYITPSWSSVLKKIIKIKIIFVSVM